MSYVGWWRVRVDSGRRPRPLGVLSLSTVFLVRVPGLIHLVPDLHRTRTGRRPTQLPRRVRASPSHDGSCPPITPGRRPLVHSWARRRAQRLGLAFRGAQPGVCPHPSPEGTPSMGPHSDTHWVFWPKSSPSEKFEPPRPVLHGLNGFADCS